MGGGNIQDVQLQDLHIEQALRGVWEAAMYKSYIGLVDIKENLRRNLKYVSI